MLKQRQTVVAADLKHFLVRQEVSLPNPEYPYSN